MIIINTDTFLKIGSQHKICEDYIISGTEPVPHIILADGCSSSNNTEMGARILCYMAKQFLKLKGTDQPYDFMGNWIITNAEMAARQLGLTPLSLDATLVVSYLDLTTDCLVARFYGDGFMFIVEGDDSVFYTETSFTNNSPYYLSYKLDSARNDEYHENKIDCIWTISDIPAKIETVARFAYDAPIEFRRQIDYCKLFMICSDGLTSFYRKGSQDSDPIEIKDIIHHFTNFKNTTGSFLQRRVGRALQKYEKENIFHADDLSIGTYLIEDK